MQRRTRLLAFVGPNEAGKTSILSGLAWLSEIVDEDHEATPLDALDKCRSNRKSTGWVVGAKFQLDEDERAVLKPLGFDVVPSTFGIWKQADGRLHLAFDPKDPKRDARPFVLAIDALTRAQTRVSKHLGGPFEDPEDNPATWFTQVLKMLDDRERQWSRDEVETASELIAWLSSAPPSRKALRGAKAAELLKVATDIARDEHPNEAGLSLMLERCPKFVLYGSEHRDLPPSRPLRALHREAGFGLRSETWFASQASTLCSFGRCRRAGTPAKCRPSLMMQTHACTTSSARLGTSRTSPWR